MNNEKLVSLLLATILLCSAIPVFAEETPAHVLVVYFPVPVRIIT